MLYKTSTEAKIPLTVEKFQKDVVEGLEGDEQTQQQYAEMLGAEPNEKLNVDGVSYYPVPRVMLQC